MTKTKTSTNKAPASPGKEPTTDVLIVLGYNEHAKPCAARFSGADPNLVAKAAKLIEQARIPLRGTWVQLANRRDAVMPHQRGLN